MTYQNSHGNQWQSFTCNSDIVGHGSENFSLGHVISPQRHGSGREEPSFVIQPPLSWHLNKGRGSDLEFCQCFLRQNGPEQCPVSWGRGNGMITCRFLPCMLFSTEEFSITSCCLPMWISGKSLCFLPCYSSHWRMSVLLIQWDFPRTLLRIRCGVLGRLSTLLTVRWLCCYPCHSKLMLVGDWWRGGGGLGICLLEEQPVRWV